MPGPFFVSLAEPDYRFIVCVEAARKLHLVGEKQLREIFDAFGDGLFVADSNGRYLDANRAGCAMMGYTLDELCALTLPDILDPSERGRLPGAIAGYADGKVTLSEWLFLRKDGSTFIGELVGGQLPDGRFQSIVRDITERRRREQREEWLKREASHRAKNVLAVVQAVARQTAASRPDAFIETLEKRIGSLAASHDLLVRNGWGETDLGELVKAQLAPFEAHDEDRLSIVGEAFEVGPESSQTLGMVLHELATNASKYGALSIPQGRVAISWAIGSGEDGEALTLRWVEEGGPPVVRPDRTGFGSRLVSRMATTALHAAINQEWHATGLRFTLVCPAGSARR